MAYKLGMFTIKVIHIVLIWVLLCDTFPCNLIDIIISTEFQTCIILGVLLMVLAPIGALRGLILQAKDFQYYSWWSTWICEGGKVDFNKVMKNNCHWCRTSGGSILWSVGSAKVLEVETMFGCRLLELANFEQARNITNDGFWPFFFCFFLFRASYRYFLYFRKVLEH